MSSSEQPSLRGSLSVRSQIRRGHLRLPGFVAVASIQWQVLPSEQISSSLSSLSDADVLRDGS